MTRLHLRPFLFVSVLLCVGVLAFAEETADKEPLAIEIPEAFYSSTPCDYYSQALEPDSFKDREPFLVPKGTTLLSRGKPVTTGAGDPVAGSLEQITDGDKKYDKDSLVALKSGLQWIQVDLEQSQNIQAILLWHFHRGERVYFDIVVQVSDDPAFKEGVTTVYNNDFDNSSGLGVGKDAEYKEKADGRLIPVDGVKARYIRLYSQGNTGDELNHYVEVEIFGKSQRGL